MSRPLLAIHRLYKHFGAISAIGDLSLELHEGEFCGLIGPNGAGKTTLMNLITGYLRPDSGEIVFQGRNISGLRPYQVCHLGIARTFQIVRPFPEMTVRENVLTGWIFSRGAGRDQHEASSHCVEILRLAGLEERQDDLAAILTLGEKKRLELARSLATRPRLLLLDEVLGGLSDEEIEHMLPVLRRVHAAGTTIVMIEHVIRVLVQLVERLVVLNFGRKLREGTPHEVLSHPDVIESYLGKETAAGQP